MSNNTMNFYQIIKQILTEESKNRIIDSMHKFIKSRGLITAIKLVGGKKELSDLMDMSINELVNKYMVGQLISTNDYSPSIVGGYNFDFIIKKINPNYDGSFYIYAHILDGTVTLIETGETFDLFDYEFRENTSWWEIKEEVSDVIYAIMLPLIELEENVSGVIVDNDL